MRALVVISMLSLIVFTLSSCSHKAGDFGRVEVEDHSKDKYSKDAQPLAVESGLDVVAPSQAPGNFENSAEPAGHKADVARGKEAGVYIATSALSGGIKMPAEGQVSQYFGDPNSKFTDGIIVNTKDGASVVAAYDGSVVYVGQELLEYGNLIILEHGDSVLSSYALLRSFNVKPGQDVKKGQEIGKTSQSMLFSMRVNGEAVDPMLYLSSK